MKRIFVTMLILLGLAVVADFGAASYAESKIAERIRTEAQLSTSPQVSIGGIPFLTQFASGEYSSITVVADNVPHPRLGSVTIDARLEGAQVARDDLIAGTVTAIPTRDLFVELRIPSAALGNALGITDLQISNSANTSMVGGPEHSARLAGTVSAFGVEQRLAVTVQLQPGDGVVRIVPTELAVGPEGINANIPTELASSILPLFAYEIGGDSLPLGLAPTDITVDAGTIIVSARAQNITIVPKELARIL